MLPSRSCRVKLMTLLLLTGLAGCGPASSDNAPNIGSRASVGGPPVSQQSLSSRNDSSTQAANPVPLALGNEAGVASEQVIVPVAGSPPTVPVTSTKATDTLAPLVVPDWIAKELNSPDVSARLRALETWAQSAPPGAVDPLILAYEDKDERVRARAMELIEQDWARAADAEK